MNRFVLAWVLAVCMTAAAQADLFTFSFDTLSNPSTPLQVETYMESIYMAGVSGLNGITVAASDDDGNIFADTGQITDYAGDEWLKVDQPEENPGSLEGLLVSFDDVPISSVSFQWASHHNEFVATADEAGGSVVFVDFFSNPSANTAGIVSTYTFENPVSALYFHDGGKGWIGIDHLTVNSELTAGAQAVVPLPGAVLLGLLGLTVAGVKLRKNAL